MTPALHCPIAAPAQAKRTAQERIHACIASGIGMPDQQARGMLFHLLGALNSRAAEERIPAFLVDAIEAAFEFGKARNP